MPARRKPAILPSVFDLDGLWIVNDKVLKDLETGRVVVHRQHRHALISFSTSPKKWGTILSKILDGIKPGGMVFFPRELSGRFALVNKTPRKGENLEKLYYVVR